MAVLEYDEIGVNQKNDDEDEQEGDANLRRIADTGR
jgi:hypothetical protein